MATLSAGILLHRGPRDAPEVLLVHPGGPFWARRDDGAWSVPKGEHGIDEDARSAAYREFGEELGVPVPDGEVHELGATAQSRAKTVAVWAVRGDLDPSRISSNTFEMEWPPRSGQQQSFPEVDRAGWFTIEQARVKLLPGQVVFLDRLVEALAEPAEPET
jgi:predicted NUDIX family NTP pyrophosphohydrolase